MQQLGPYNETRNQWALLILSLFVLLCYSNTFDAGWHLDDSHNILTNTRLHMDAFSIDAIKNTFSALPSDPGNKIWRPLPCLSLALNWYWGKDDPFGYHLVNLGFHLLTACFLFLTAQLLLITPAITTQLNAQDKRAIALLAATLWAVNPIQTQAVTYVVQRMAVMTAMFSIIGLYAYLRARFAGGWRRWVWYFIVLTAFACALLSKENAILFPCSVMLIEIIFFGQLLPIKRYKALFSTRNIIIVGILLAAGAIIILNITGNPINFDQYDRRPFSLWERLISQPRILVFYLSLIFFPAPWRLSIEHDIDHSISLLAPWTTLPGILAIIGFVVVAILRIRKNPLLSFAILFFFVNHLVESTVLPLELVFEHRNYLPSLFLFLPLSFLIHQKMDHYRQKRRSVTILLVLSLTLCLCATGLACYERNKAWATDYSLWYDAVQKAPGRARPLMALGVAIGWGKEEVAGRYDIALNLFQRALTLSIARKNETAQLHGNIALAHIQKGDLSAAIDAFERALENQPNNRKIRYDFLETLINAGKWNEAQEQADRLIAGKRSAPVDLNYKGIIKLWLGEPQEALTLFQEAMDAGLHDPFIHHNIGSAMTELGYFSRGRRFLRSALKLAEEDSHAKIWIYFSLIENRYKAGDGFGARGATYGLLARYGLDEVKDTLKRLPNRYAHPPVDISRVSRLIGRYLQEIALTIRNRSGPAEGIDPEI